MTMNRKELADYLREIANILEISVSQGISPETEKVIYDEGFRDGVDSNKFSVDTESIKKMSGDMSRMSHEIESYKAQIRSLKKTNLELSKKIKENKDYSALLFNFCDVLSYVSMSYPGLPCMYCNNRVMGNRCKSRKCTGYNEWSYKPLDESLIE